MKAMSTVNMSPIPAALRIIVIATLLLSLTDRSYSQGFRDPEYDKFKIVPVDSANTDADEYSPYVTPSGKLLYFTSSRNGSADIYRSRHNDSTWMAPIFISEFGVNSHRDDGSFSAPIPALTLLFNLDDEALQKLPFPHIGLLASGKRKGGAGDADIYLASLNSDGSTLDSIEPLSMVNSNAWDSQPTIAPDGSFIIFSSTRRGGSGNMDLYISYRDSSGKYSDPINMGFPINTKGSEISPFIAPDGITLYFSTDGQPGGYGGMDIYRTQRTSEGSWTTPQNLGPLINTSANEAFFYGANRRRCLFASDRSGGKGGLDLYEATPNIFATSYSTLQVQLRDTVYGEKIGGKVRVVETTLGRTVADLNVKPDSTPEIVIASGFSYRLEGTSDTSYKMVAYDMVDNVQPSEYLKRTLNLGRPLPELPPEPPALPEAPPPPADPPVQPPPPPPPPWEVIVEEVNELDVPWFVSGYYRINTPTTLTQLQNFQKHTDLMTDTYIANVTTNDKNIEMYQKYGSQISAVLGRFVQKSMQRYFPAYQKFLSVTKANERLELVVYGFADPRPIIGVYHEGPLKFQDSAGATHELKFNEKFDNFKLAGSRAYYARQTIEDMFRKYNGGRNAYNTLLKKGLITWRVVSGNVDDLVANQEDAEKLGTLRRIRIEFNRLDMDDPENQSKGSKIELNGSATDTPTDAPTIEEASTTKTTKKKKGK